MSAFRRLLCALTLTLLVPSVESWSDGCRWYQAAGCGPGCRWTLLNRHTDGGPNQPGTMDLNLSGAELTRLDNSRVNKAERMKQLLGSSSSMVGPFSHSGVRVTLADGSRWLIHKGHNFGISSQTVVVDARHMSSDWTVVKVKDFQGRKTVGDFVATGGSDYDLLFDNCHLASIRMMNQ